MKSYRMTCFSTIRASTHVLELGKPVVMQACYCSITVAAHSLDAALSLVLKPLSHSENEHSPATL
jgi:hypothetical protein